MDSDRIIVIMPVLTMTMDLKFSNHNVKCNGGSGLTVVTVSRVLRVADIFMHLFRFRVQK